jgi:hypothetical protein
LRRRLLNLLTAGSLLLSAAVVVVWVRSHFAGDCVVYCTASATRPFFGGFALISTGGVVEASWTTWRFDRTEALDVFVRTHGVGLAYRSGEPSPPNIEWRPWWVSLGFDAQSYTDTSNEYRFRQNPKAVEPLGKRTLRATTVTFPHWLPWLVFLAAGWATVRRVIYYATRKTGNSGGKCRSCGYDLRATPDRCPECGAAAGTAGAA